MGGLRMLWKTFLTWEGSGRAVMTMSYVHECEQIRQMH